MVETNTINRTKSLSKVNISSSFFTACQYLIFLLKLILVRNIMVTIKKAA